MEAKKFYDLISASWRPRKGFGASPFELGVRTRRADVVNPNQGQEKVKGDTPAYSGAGKRGGFLLHLSFALFRFLIDCMIPTHTLTWGKAIGFPEYTDSNAISPKKLHHRHIQN